MYLQQYGRNTNLNLTKPARGMTTQRGLNLNTFQWQKPANIRTLSLQMI